MICICTDNIILIYKRKYEKGEGRVMVNKTGRIKLIALGQSN
jgi:hypothetical protein